MRVNFLISIILIALMVLSSCSPQSSLTAEKLMEEVVDLLGEDLHSCRYVYKKSASVYSRSHFSHELAGYIYLK